MDFVDLSLHEQLIEAEESMLKLAHEFLASTDTHIVGMGEGLCVAVAEIRRVRSVTVTA